MCEEGLQGRHFGWDVYGGWSWCCSGGGMELELRVVD